MHREREKREIRRKGERGEVCDSGNQERES